MLKLNRKMRKFEEAFNVNQGPISYYVGIRTTPVEILDGLSSIFSIVQKKPVAQENVEIFGPFENLESSRRFCLDHYKKFYPEDFAESLKYNDEMQLVTKGFLLFSMNHLLFTKEGYLKKMEDSKNFCNLPLEPQNRIREEGSFKEAIREERAAVIIRNKRPETRSPKEKRFIHNLSIEENHARMMSEFDPFYKTVLNRLQKARELVSKQQSGGENL